jgi:hypothetical protein
LQNEYTTILKINIMNNTSESPREIRIITPEIEKRNDLRPMWPNQEPPKPVQPTPQPAPTTKPDKK